ncbi:MAG: right-handed parallel beta-helix repeat-containing protein [Lewinellaceae bacterium]|nr:right-handed parallel beta-helix repeat-containing protein [Lewinellaceae bacterium]
MSRIQWAFVWLLLIPFQALAQGNAAIYFVAPGGKARNPGTAGRPFATAQQARDAIRKARTKAPEQHYTVVFREGVYVMPTPFELNAADSGTAQFPVTYRAYNGEKVVFTGGTVLQTADFRPVADTNMLNRLLPEVRGKVLQIDLLQAGITDFGIMQQHGFGKIPEPAPLELFINGERQTLARYPNEGALKVGKVYDPGSVPRTGDFSDRGAEFGYEYDRPQRWFQAKDIWLHGRFSFGYNDDHLRVDHIDTTKKTIRTAQPHLYGVVSGIYVDSGKWSDMAGLSLRNYYVYNVPEEIDLPGEWYLDRASGKLYLYPPDSFLQARVEISMLEDPLVQLKETAHVNMENICFSTSRGMGIYLENAHHIGIRGCEFANLGTVAISAGQPLQHNKQGFSLDGSPLLDEWTSTDFHHISIQNCRIADTGTGGIILTGGDRRSLVPSMNTVSHCEFSGVDRRNHSYAAALKLFGVGIQADHCRFSDLRHMAISLRGNDHVIEHNLFERICTYADDMGAIYMGRDPASRGNIIRSNHFRDIVPADGESQVGAVFLDDGICATTVSGNFFERAGSTGDKELFGAVFIHGGHGNTVYHNVFLDCDMAIGNNYWPDDTWKAFLEKPIIRERLLEEVDITSRVYLDKYPDLNNWFTEFGPRLNKVAENYLINSNMAINGKYELFFNHLETPANTGRALKKIGYDENTIGPAPGN